MVMGFRRLSRYVESSLVLSVLLWGGFFVPSPALAQEASPTVSPEPPHQPPPPKFLLKDLKITGNTLIGTDMLMRRACCIVGELVDLADLERIAGLITDLYRHQGYTVASAFIPSQDISDGMVEILVLEGAVSDVVVTGNVLYSTKFIEGRFAPVFAGKALKNLTLERVLLLLNDTTDLKVAANLAPGKEVGTTRITATVEDQPANAPSALAKRPVHLFLNFNNYGFTVISRNRADIGADVGNLLFEGSTASYRAIIGEDPDRMLFHTAAYGVPINHIGTKLVLSGSSGRFDVGGSLAELGIQGTINTVDISVIHPFIKTRFTSLLAEVGFAAKNNELFLLGEKSGDDRLRMVKVGLNGDWLDSTGRSFLSAYGFQGIGHALGGMGDNDPLVTRHGADNRFTKGVLTAGRVQAVTQEQFLVLRGNGQITTGPVAIIEQFLLGGFDSVRGYQLGEYFVDEGYTVSAEYRVPAFLTPQANNVLGGLFGKGNFDLGSYMQLLAFVDHGAGRVRAPSVGERRYHDLTGAGVGTRINLPYYESTLSFDVGFPLGLKPLGGTIGGGDSPTFYIQLSGKY